MDALLLCDHAPVFGFFKRTDFRILMLQLVGSRPAWSIGLFITIQFDDADSMHSAVGNVHPSTDGPDLIRYTVNGMGPHDLRCCLTEDQGGNLRALIDQYPGTGGICLNVRSPACSNKIDRNTIKEFERSEHSRWTAYWYCADRLGRSKIIADLLSSGLRGAINFDE